jgi:uncharacterized protein (DUF2235 family)
MARAIYPGTSEGMPQVVFYDEGVGTGNILERVTGGAFGDGLEKNVADAYRFLMLNYEEGDEVFLFGFSRGAYTARSTVGLIRNCGLLHKTHADRVPEAYDIYRSRKPEDHPDSPKMKRFRDNYAREIEIKFIGVWDTVGALGIPISGLRHLTRNKREFHDVTLSGIVKNACHALAIDEQRDPFRPTLWTGDAKPGQNVEQVWFAGVHSDNGGGSREGGLAGITFMWMKQKAEACGLAFDEDYIKREIIPDHLDMLHNSRGGVFKYTKTFIRPIGKANANNEYVHHSARARHESGSAKYSPSNLVEYLNTPGHKIAE